MTMHNALKYALVCKFCGKEFMGKRKHMKVCYEEECQRKQKAHNHHMQYLRKKARKNDGA